MNTAFRRALTAVIAAALIFSFSSCREIGEADTTTAVAEQSTQTEDVSDITPNETRAAAADGKLVVCIDPGHGFGDVGCESQYIDCYEKDITIVVAEKLKALLEDEGVTVILTHDGESYPSEDEIRSLANQYGIEYKSEEIKDGEIFSAYERAIYENILDAQYGLDFFISLHVNSVENAEYVDGFSLDYYENNPNSAMLEQFCAAAEKKLAEDFDYEIVIFADSYEDAYKVTKYTECPSVLFEMGYATNPSDAENLLSDSWQQSLAESLCSLITDALPQA